VLQLHLLERETFLAIWIAVFGGLALYLFGKIRLPHDSPLEYISVGRLSLGLVVLTFTIYLIPGLWGAPLQWISGFPPPMQYSESPYGVGNSEGGGLAATPKTLEEGMELGPLDLPVFKDYERGMAYAKKEGKPVLLDFTGYACVNCRKMEERVWPDPQVESILRDEVVLISLYVDDKKELPEEEQYVSETTGHKVRTIGNKWSDFQITHYKANAQPYYVLIDNEGAMLEEPTAYDPDIESYTQWLKDGIKAYKKK
ncbi:thioredoxin family protein, partial [Zunongwangia sp.]|uniref:thioredoxin family protein n=1 Tax=Zunongwangia sp. TaxID=1965325 RepID=UPI003AA98F9A